MASSWFSLYSTIKMMHGPINVRYKYSIAVAEVYVAGPYSWVASGGEGGGVLYCVCYPLCCYFYVFAGYQSRVRVISVKLL